MITWMVLCGMGWAGNTPKPTPVLPAMTAGAASPPTEKVNDTPESAAAKGGAAKSGAAKSGAASTAEPEATDPGAGEKQPAKTNTPPTLWRVSLSQRTPVALECDVTWDKPSPGSPPTPLRWEAGDGGDRFLPTTAGGTPTVRCAPAQIVTKDHAVAYSWQPDGSNTKLQSNWQFRGTSTLGEWGSPVDVLTLSVTKEQAPDLKQAKAYLHAESAGAARRSLSSPVPALVSDTLDIVTEIVISKAKAGAFDVVRSSLEDWVCEDATLPADSFLPIGLEPLRGEPLLPNTCQVVKGLTLPALANAAEALTKAVREDALEAGLVLARGAITGTAPALPFSGGITANLIHVVEEMAHESRALSSVPVKIEELASAVSRMLASPTAANINAYQQALSTTLTVSGASTPLTACLVTLTQTQDQACLNTLGSDSWLKLPAGQARLQETKAAWDIARLADPSAQGTAATRLDAVTAGWKLITLVLRTGAEDLELAVAADALRGLERRANQPLAHLDAHLADISDRWLVSPPPAGPKKLRDALRQLGGEIALAELTGDHRVLRDRVVAFGQDQLPGHDDWTPVSKALLALQTTMSSAAKVTRPSDVDLDAALTSADGDTTDVEMARRRMLLRLLLETQQKDERATLAAGELAAWITAETVLTHETAWFVPEYQTEARVTARLIAASVTSGAMVEGTALHELLEKLSPTLREIASNPRGFDLTDAQAALGTVASVSWSEEYGATAASCSIDLAIAVTGLCQRDGGCDGLAILDMLNEPETKLNLGDCTDILEESSALKRFPALPGLVTNAVHILDPARAASDRDQVRAAVDFGFGVAEILVEEQAGDVAGAEAYVGSLHTLTLGLIDEDMVAVAMSGVELITSALTLMEDTGGGGEALAAVQKTLDRAVPVVSTLAANARSLQEASTDPGNAEALRAARKAALEDLIESSTRRTNRAGDTIVSLGVPVGIRLPVVTPCAETWSWRCGAPEEATGDEGATAKKEATQSDAETNWDRGFEAAALSLPIGLGIQHLPRGTEVNHHGTWLPSLPPRLGGFIFMSPIDLGHFASEADMQTPRWNDLVVADLQFGALFGSKKRPTSPLALAIDLRFIPGGEADGDRSIGISASYYVPIFDLN